MKRSGYNWTLLSTWIALFFLLAVAMVGCGGGGGGNGGPTSNAFAGRYVGSFDESGSAENKEQGTFLFTVNNSGAATGVISSFRTASSVEAAGTISGEGAVSNFAGTVETGGTTYTFTGSISSTTKIASGSWTSSGGALGSRNGTWTAAPAPATNPYAGRYTGTVTEDGSLFDISVANDCTVTGTMTGAPAGAPSRHHKASHYGVIDPATGRITWNLPFSPSGEVQADVARAILGTIDLILADAALRGIEVSLADREIIRLLQAQATRDTSTKIELERIVNESGTKLIQPGGTITTGGIELGDFDDGDYSQAFVSFDTSAIPLTATIVDAKWEVSQESTTGNPFGLGSAFAELTSYQGNSFPTATGAIAEGSKVLSNTLVNGVRQIDVTDLVRNRANKSRFQLRLRMATTTNNDAQADRVRFVSRKLTIRYR